MQGKNSFTTLLIQIKKGVSSTIAEAPFFSLLLDSSTDKSNVDNEFSGVIQMVVHTRVSFLNIERLERAMAEGLSCHCNMHCNH